MLSRICFDDIYIFTKVAENKSITITSEKLGMSKQTVSRRISKLEESLNILLIARTTRSFELTSAGIEYYQHCADVFREVEKYNDVITEFQKTPSGTVKLGMPEYFPFCYFSIAITEYLKLNPGINIHISYNFKDCDLVKHNIDIAFRIGALNDSSMIARRVGTIKFVYVASNEYLNNNGYPNNLCDLKHHKFIEVKNFFRSYNHMHKQKVTSSNIYIAKEFAVSGFGISMLPLCLTLTETLQGKLVILEGDDFVIEDDINIVFLTNRHLPRQVRELIDFIVSFGH